MRYIVLTAVSVLVISAGALAQTTDPIEKALLAATAFLQSRCSIPALTLRTEGRPAAPPLGFSSAGFHPEQAL